MTINKLRLYNGLYTILKEECINDISKRTVSNLRLLFCEYTFQKLDDRPGRISEAKEAGVK